MKRWMKWIGIAFLVPLALILLLSVLLYFPPVQDFARNKIVAYASTSTGIDIRITKVRLSFPLNLTIQDVLALRTPADTLLKLQSLEVRVKLLPLLKSKVGPLRSWTHRLLKVLESSLQLSKLMLLTPMASSLLKLEHIDWFA